MQRKKIKEWVEKTKEETEQEIEKGEKEEELYTEEGREVLMDVEDEITDVDEGLMEGFEEGENLAKCTLCHKILVQDCYEREFDGETYRFCSEEHAEIYAKQRALRRIKEKPEEKY